MVYLSTPGQVHFFKFVCAVVLEFGLFGFLLVAIKPRRYGNGGQS